MSSSIVRLWAFVTWKVFERIEGTEAEGAKNSSWSSAMAPGWLTSSASRWKPSWN
jgi:hypothetical protein